MKWRDHKKKISLLLVVVLMVFCVGFAGVLDKNDQDMKGVWTFWKDVDLKQDLDVDSTLTVDGASTLTGNVTASGDVAVTGSVTVADEVVLAIHSATASYTHTLAVGNIIQMTKVAGGATNAYNVTLPAITAAMDGYVITIKQLDSATTPTAMVPNTADRIEMTRSTVTGTSDTTTRDIGDTRTWVADYNSSTTTGVWLQLWANGS